jgi:hypothetical protein
LKKINKKYILKAIKAIPPTIVNTQIKITNFVSRPECDEESIELDFLTISYSSLLFAAEII